tara:strand:+ start:1144 stop:1878 length:735 start_codon:yes stop_codon:yes gene_type:complete
LDLHSTKKGIVIPFYNEACRFDQMHVLDHAELIDCWVFVDDGSTDKTNQKLSELVKTLNQMEVSALLVSLPINQGKAEAVRQGMLEISKHNCDLCGFIDADFSAPVTEFIRLCEVATEKDVEMVFGSRVLLYGRDIQRSSVRHYAGRIAATLISIMLRFEIYDTQAGIKLFRIECVNELMGQPFLSRWLFDCEIFLRAKNKQLKMIEEPLNQWCNQSADSKVNMMTYCKSLIDLYRIWWHWRSK